MDTPVLVRPQDLEKIALGKEYRFFGHVVGEGHKGLVVHLQIVGAQEIGSQPSGRGDAEDRAPHP
jgi:hypothetical protein